MRRDGSRPMERSVPVQSLPEDDFDENPGMAVKYDRIGDTYDRTRRADPRIADRLVSLLESVPGASVLISAVARATIRRRWRNAG